MKANNESKAVRSKKVRTILNRYRVDTSSLQISTSLRGINLYGSLIKYDGSDFTIQAVVSMTEELGRIGAVYSDLDNWDFNGGIRKKDKAS